MAGVVVFNPERGGGSSVLPIRTWLASVDQSLLAHLGDPLLGPFHGLQAEVADAVFEKDQALAGAQRFSGRDRS